MSFQKIERQANSFYELSGLSLSVCRSLALFINNKNRKQMAIIAEKHLLTEEQNEELKKYGLTVLDMLESKFDKLYEPIVYDILGEWNTRLGEPVYNYRPVQGKEIEYV